LETIWFKARVKDVRLPDRSREFIRISMSKKICKEDDKKVIAKRSSKADYKCKSCGAEADKEKFLCKPKKI
jgi:hypothetical protein